MKAHVSNPCIFRLKKLFIATLVIIAVAGFALHFVLWFYWLDHNPVRPLPETGQTYVLNNHGYYFYVTKNQSLMAETLPFASVMLFFVAAILGKEWEVKDIKWWKP